MRALNWIKISNFTMFVPYSSNYDWFVQGNDLTDCLWLDITSYDPCLELKTYSLRTKWFGSLCPQSSAWCLILLSLNVNQYSARRSWYSWSYPWGNDSIVNIDGYLGCSSSLSLWPVLIFFLMWEEQVQSCHHMSVYK